MLTTSPDQEWDLYLRRVAIPLWALDSNKRVVKLGTGTLIDFEGKSILITAAHIDPGDVSWCILLRYESESGARLYPPGPLQRFEDERIDFAYAFVPSDLQPIYQEFSKTGKLLGEIDRLILVTDLTNVPEEGRRYRFAGFTDPFIVHEQQFLGGIFITEKTLRYVERRDDRYIFKLEGTHPGREYYEGSSGTAICDDAMTFVGILLAGDTTTNEIHVLPFDVIRSALAAACMSAK